MIILDNYVNISIVKLTLTIFISVLEDLCDAYFSILLMKMFNQSKLNKRTQKLIQLDPHQILNSKEKERQIQLNNHKTHR